MSNKFLGLDSINVLKDYIDNQILINENRTRFVTIHAYKYVEDGTVPEAPINGGFDSEGVNIIYPIGWFSLQTVLTNIGDNAAIEAALANGSIWLSVGVVEGNADTSWSAPMKISGQNGVSVRFAYSYDPSAEEANRTSNPSGVNQTNRVEYVWTKYGDDAWVGPTIWAMYASDASDVLYRYRVTATADNPGAPVSDVDSNWTTSAAASITSDAPFMWMTWKRVPAGSIASEIMWSEPILFGHYGMDGKDGKDGLDGNIPDYTITLYAMSDSIETTPEFICETGNLLEDVVEANKDVWFDLPVHEDATESTIWWNVVMNINGGTRENPELKDTVKNFSNVRRYSALDGEVSTSVYTKYLFYWSSNQTIAEDLAFEEWVEVPEYKADEQDGSLWMIVNTCKVNTKTGEVETLGDWSTPVKLTGPRGPIAYDYRQESLFGAGTADKAPTTWKRMSEVKTSTTYPYIWEKRYLALYKMKYADTANADGSYDVIEDKFLKTIGDADVFRLSGLDGKIGADGKDGANGNRLNTIHYAIMDEHVSISNFDDTNYFISNASEDTHYTLNGNKFGDFVSGYTGKFANVGTGNMIIEAIDADIVGGSISASEVIVKPQESIDLVTYLNTDRNNNIRCEFILLGKALANEVDASEIVTSKDQLLTAVENGGNIKLNGHINLDTTPLIITKDTVVDMNGFTITGPKFMESGGKVLEGDTDSYVFWVKEGDLTIRGNGRAIAQPADYSMAVWCQGGNVTIESGEFYNGGESCSLIYASAEGQIVINGGKFVATPKGPQAGTGDDYTALNIKNSDVATASITVRGGHFYKFNPADNLAEGEHINFVDEGYSSILNGDYYSVIKNPEI